MPTPDPRLPLFDAAFDAEAAREFSLNATLRRVRIRRRARKAARGLAAAAAVALLALPFFPSRQENADAPVLITTVIPRPLPTPTPEVELKKPEKNPLVVRSRAPEPDVRVRTRSRLDLFVKTGQSAAVARVSTSPETTVPRLEEVAFNQVLAEQEVACIAINGEPFRILPLRPEKR